MGELILINKKFMMIAIFLVSLLAISAVSANEINSTDEDSLKISMDNENTIQKIVKEDFDLENNLNESFEEGPVSLENDNFYGNDEPEFTKVKLETITTPTNPGDNTVVFKLTKVEDNSPLANMPIGVKTNYDHYIDGITTDSNGLAIYHHPLDSGTYSLIAGLGDANGFGSKYGTFKCDVLFFDITIREPTDGSFDELEVSGNSFEDIQTAVYTVKKGGTVKLSGNFKGTGLPIKINRDLTLVGVGNTILDGNCSGLILNIVSDDVSMKNLTFINGYVDLDNFKKSDKRFAVGAIQATGNNILIQNCKFISNQGFLYGAIDMEGNHSTIEDCSFVANEVFLKSGHTYTEYEYDSNGRKIEIKYSYLNTAGAFRWSGNDNLVSNCEFIDNVGYVDFIFVGENNIIKESKLVLSASDITKYVGGPERYTVTLTDNGVPVSNVNVEITVNGKSSTVKTNSKGQASVSLDLNVGSYDVISVYDDLRTASKVNVRSTINVSDVKGTYLNSKVTATFLDTAGKALAFRQVTFKIGTATYSATTNSNGVATADIPLGVGNYTVTAINPVNNEQKQFKLTISKGLPSITLSASQNMKGTTLTAVFAPSTATGTVTFSINFNETYNAAVNNGKASVTIPDMLPGTYTLSVIYGGDSNFGIFLPESISFNVEDSYPILTANSLTKTYGTSNKLIVNLMDSKGNAMATEVVDVNINGRITSIITNSKGQATMPITLAPGPYTATITYLDLMTTAKISVKKATPKLTAKAKTLKKSDKTKKYTVTLKNNLNKAMKSTKITVKVNGKTFTAITGSNGVATFKLNKLTKKGKYTATVKYAGSKYYNSKTVKVKITVK